MLVCMLRSISLIELTRIKSEHARYIHCYIASPNYNSGVTIERYL